MTITLNRAAQALFSGSVLNASTIGAALAEVLKETVGPGSIAEMHLRKGQGGEWTKNTEKWSRDKRKAGARGKVFEQTGATRKAITTPMRGAVLRDFGSSTDVYSTNRGSTKRVTSAGVYAQMRVSSRQASLTVGLNGLFKHSAAFGRARKDAAVAAGANLKGLRGKARRGRINRFASISDAQKRLKSGRQKWARRGSLGLGGLARGTDNLAHANLLQRGEFKGIKSGALTFTPSMIAGRRKRGKATEGTAVHRKPMPLMPFRPEDEARVAAALERALTTTLEAL